MSEIIIREIEENDLEKGFLESLDFLRKASDIDKNKAKEILKKIKQNTNHIIHVAVDETKLLALLPYLLNRNLFMMVDLWVISVSYTHLTLPTNREV